MITGAYDLNSNPPPDVPTARLEATYILPVLSILDSNFSSEDELVRASAFWKCMRRYFPGLYSHFENVNVNINSNGVDNMMMLIEPLQFKFTEFVFTLKPVPDTPNTSHDHGHRYQYQYRMRTFNRFSTLYNILPSTRIVTFTSHDDGDYHPLPNPVFLETHAAIANILDATGRGELIEKLQREYFGAFGGGGCIRRLARDGSTNIGKILSVSCLALLASSEE